MIPIHISIPIYFILSHFHKILSSTVNTKLLINIIFIFSSIFTIFSIKLFYFRLIVYLFFRKKSHLGHYLSYCSTINSLFSLFLLFMFYFISLFLSYLMFHFYLFCFISFFLCLNLSLISLTSFVFVA